MKEQIRRRSITLWTMVVGIVLLPLFAFAGLQQGTNSYTSPTGAAPSSVALKAMQTSAKMATLHADMAQEYAQEAKQHNKQAHALKINQTADIKSMYKHVNKTNDYKLKSQWHEEQAKKWTT